MLARKKSVDEALQAFKDSFTSPEWDTSLLKLMADDVVMEFPFGPPGRPTRLSGKQEIASYFTELKKVIRLDRIRVTETYKTDDPNLVVLKAEGKGAAIQTGRPFEPKYVDFLTFRDGMLVLWQDYWSPLAFLIATEVITMPNTPK